MVISLRSQPPVAPIGPHTQNMPLDAGWLAGWLVMRWSITTPHHSNDTQAVQTTTQHQPYPFSISEPLWVRTFAINATPDNYYRISHTFGLLKWFGLRNARDGEMSKDTPTTRWRGERTVCLPNIRPGWLVVLWFSYCSKALWLLAEVLGAWNELGLPIFGSQRTM